MEPRLFSSNPTEWLAAQIQPRSSLHLLTLGIPHAVGTIDNRPQGDCVVLRTERDTPAMINNGLKALIVVHDVDTALVLETILRDEGYVVETTINEDSSVLVRVKELIPDVIILDILPTDTQNDLELLDALRGDSTAKRIPVLAMSSMSSLEGPSLASYNVKATITKPFDLTELLQKITETLGQPPLHANLPEGLPPRPETLAQVERTLNAHSRDVLLRWITHLRETEPWKSHPNIGTKDLIDTVPLLLEALVTSLHYQNPEYFYEQHMSVIEKVKSHSLIRRSQGFSLPSLILEYAMLRQEIWSTIWRYHEGSVQPAEVYTVQKALDGTFDRIIAETIPAYIEADIR